MSRTANMGDNGWFAITHFFLSIDNQTCPLGPEYFKKKFHCFNQKILSSEKTIYSNTKKKNTWQNVDELKFLFSEQNLLSKSTSKCEGSAENFTS